MISLSAALELQIDEKIANNINTNLIVEELMVLLHIDRYDFS